LDKIGVNFIIVFAKKNPLSFDYSLRTLSVNFSLEIERPHQPKENLLL